MTDISQDHNQQSQSIDNKNPKKSNLKLIGYIGLVVCIIIFFGLILGIPWYGDYRKVKITIIKNYRDPVLNKIYRADTSETKMVIGELRYDVKKSRIMIETKDSLSKEGINERNRLVRQYISEGNTMMSVEKYSEAISLYGKAANLGDTEAERLFDIAQKNKYISEWGTKPKKFREMIFNQGFNDAMYNRHTLAIDVIKSEIGQPTATYRGEYGLVYYVWGRNPGDKPSVSDIKNSPFCVEMFYNLLCENYLYESVTFYIYGSTSYKVKQIGMGSWNEATARDMALSIMQKEHPDWKHTISSIHDINFGNGAEKLIIVGSEETEFEQSKESLFKFSKNSSGWSLSEKNIFPLDFDSDDWSYSLSLIKLGESIMALKASRGKTGGRVWMQSTRLFEFGDGSIKTLKNIFEYAYSGSDEVTFDFQPGDGSHPDIKVSRKWPDGNETVEVFRFDGESYRIVKN